MRFQFFSAAFWLAFFFTRTIADITLHPFPSNVTLGETYTVSWTATANYTYTLWLVQDNSPDNTYDWSKVLGIGTGLDFKTFDASYPWTVPSNLSTGVAYALWLDGFNIPFNGASYSTMTEYFAVTAAHIPTSSASSGAAAGATSGATSSPSSSTSSNSHHNSLSGGAIAGIVIGCLAALGLVIGAFLLLAKRRKRSTVEDREAEARAQRLEPVMQEHYPGYEMQNRNSRAA